MSEQDAGAGVSDQEMAEQVAGQTDSDLKAEDVFERESGGTSTDKPAADLEADDIE